MSFVARFLCTDDQRALQVVLSTSSLRPGRGLGQRPGRGRLRVDVFVSRGLLRDALSSGRVVLACLRSARTAQQYDTMQLERRGPIACVWPVIAHSIGRAQCVWTYLVRSVNMTIA